VQPELIPCSVFGSFLALGLGLGVALSTRLAERAGLSRREGADALVLALGLALPFSRLFYVLGSPEAEPLTVWFALGQGGLSGYGALLGATLGALLALRRARGRRFAWLDVATPGVLLTALITRLGCYLEGCDFGRPLPSTAPAWLSRLGSFPAQSRALHPTELYEAVGLALLLGLALLARRKQRRFGVVFTSAGIGYGALRFATDGLRGDADRGVYALINLTPALALASSLALALTFTLQLARARRSS
jgi:phosphatidylglycerol:prolipoprotein diacylglycerol transferase